MPHGGSETVAHPPIHPPLLNTAYPLRQRPQTAAPSRQRKTVRDHLQWKWDPLRIAIFALLVITISRVHQAAGFLAATRPALILFGFAAVYAMVNPRRLGDGSWFRTWPARVLMALGVLACLSAPFGISLGGSASFIISYYSKVLIVAFVLMAMIKGPRDLAMMAWAYVVGTAILVWMAVFWFQLTYTSGYSAGRLNNLLTYDANDLGVVLLVGFGLTLLMFQTAARGKTKIFSGVVLAGIGMALARSGSRGAFLGLLAVGAYLLIALPRISAGRRLAFVGATLLGLMIAAPPGYWQQMQSLGDPKSDENWSAPDGRRQTALRGIGYMLNYPVFGVGINNFPRAEAKISDRAQNYVQQSFGRAPGWRAAHNSYVQAGSEMGIPGLILWSSLIFGGIVSMRRLRRKIPEAWLDGDPEQRFLYLATIYLPVSLIGFAVSCFFVSFAYVDPIYILAAMMTGVHVSVRKKLKESAPVAAARRRGARRRVAFGHPVPLGHPVHAAVAFRPAGPPIRR